MDYGRPAATVEDVGVDHCRLGVLVTEEFLNGADPLSLDLRNAV